MRNESVRMIRAVTLLALAAPSCGYPTRLSLEQLRPQVAPAGRRPDKRPVMFIAAPADVPTVITAPVVKVPDVVAPGKSIDAVPGETVGTIGLPDARSYFFDLVEAQLRSQFSKVERSTKNTTVAASPMTLTVRIHNPAVRFELGGVGTQMDRIRGVAPYRAVALVAFGIEVSTCGASATRYVRAVSDPGDASLQHASTLLAQALTRGLEQLQKHLTQARGIGTCSFSVDETGGNE